MERAEVPADKAYNSTDNYNAVHSAGGTTYIPSRTNTIYQLKGSNATGKSRGGFSLVMRVI